MEQGTDWITDTIDVIGTAIEGLNKMQDEANRFFMAVISDLSDTKDNLMAFRADLKEYAKAEKEEEEQEQDNVRCKIFNPTDRDNIKALTDEMDDLKELVAKLANKVTKNESRIGRVEGQIIKNK